MFSLILGGRQTAKPRANIVFFWHTSKFFAKKSQNNNIFLIKQYQCQEKSLSSRLNFIVNILKDELINTIIEGLQNGKAHDIRVIDMTKLEEAAFNYFIVCEGSSSTQVYGIANTLIKHVREASGQHNQGVVGMNNRQWIAIDYGYILVHVFQPETREFYSLESLWEDADITVIEDLD